MKTAIERAIGVWRGLNNGVEYGGAYATQQIRNAIQEAIDEARNEALDEAAAHLRSVADVIDSQGNVTSHTIARLYRAEAEAVLALAATTIAAGE